MIVNILIHIERCEDIKCVAEVDFPWNRGVASKDWEEVRGADHQVHVNNGHRPVLVVEIRLDDPHAGIRIRSIERLLVVVNKRT